MNNYKALGQFGVGGLVANEYYWHDEIPILRQRAFILEDEEGWVDFFFDYWYFGEDDCMIQLEWEA